MCLSIWTVFWGEHCGQWASCLFSLLLGISKLDCLKCDWYKELWSFLKFKCFLKEITSTIKDIKENFILLLRWARWPRCINWFRKIVLITLPVCNLINFDISGKLLRLLCDGTAANVIHSRCVLDISQLRTWKWTVWRIV